jgi:uncharacterized protein (DUF58 family)
VITTQGWMVAAVGGVLVVAGRLLGIFELIVLGIGVVGVVVAGLVFVAQARLRLGVSRALHPHRVHAGSPARVDLRVVNEGDRRTPLVELRDPVGDTQLASIVLGPLLPDAVVDAEYRLDTSRRGITKVGPLSVEVSDPFGLARSSREVVPAVELTVWPAVDDVPPLPHTAGDDPHDGADRPNAGASRGDEFYALRPYVQGDDLRRVHWRTTARRDEPVVRQDRPPWQARSTILLDTRHEAHHPAGFERAVSAAASVAMSCARRGHLVRLVTTDGFDSGHNTGHAHVESLLERLALVRTGAGSLADALTTLSLPGRGGALALLLGGAGPDGGAGAAGAAAVAGYQRVVTVTFDERTPASFPEAWRLALAARRPVGVAW